MLEELNKVLPALGTVVSVHNSLAGLGILRWGNEAQRHEMLPRVASGEWLGAYALSEAHAGSDPASMRTSAVRRGDVYIVNGTKTWITSGEDAGVFILFAVTDKTVKPSRGISAFAVPAGTPGVIVGRREDKMGIRASTTNQIIFENAEVPARYRLNEEGMGFKIAMSLLDGGRIGIAAQGLGIAEGACEAATSYALQREQFGQPIANFQAIQFMLADMSAAIEGARLLLRRAAFLKDQGRPIVREAAEAKLVASEVAQRVVTDALQIHGAAGYSTEFPLERLYRDVRVYQIWEGTSQIQRLVISRQLLR
jgi:acyl-CoA dehydrogenase